MFNYFKSKYKKQRDDVIMKKHYEFINKLSPYLNHDLNDLETFHLEEHLKACDLCRKELEDIKQIDSLLSQKPLFHAKDQSALIIEQAKTLLQTQQIPEQRISFKNSISEFFKLFTQLRYKVALAALLVILVLLFLLNNNSDNLYITHVSGAVFINQKLFTKNTAYKYALNNININVEKGECVVQINNKKLIIIKHNSAVVIKKTKEKNNLIELKSGEIICSVKKINKHTQLIVQCPEVSFKITGTIFFLKNNADGIQCGMKQGCIESSYDNHIYTIRF